jgi:hypothetical protein
VLQTSVGTAYPSRAARSRPARRRGGRSAQRGSSPPSRNSSFVTRVAAARRGVGPDRTPSHLQFLVVELRGFEPLTPCMPCTFEGVHVVLAKFERSLTVPTLPSAKLLVRKDSSVLQVSDAAGSYRTRVLRSSPGKSRQLATFVATFPRRQLLGLLGEPGQQREFRPAGPDRARRRTDNRWRVEPGNRRPLGTRSRRAGSASRSRAGRRDRVIHGGERCHPP